MRKIISVNENYFSKINSEDKAYFLGLLFADGCLIDSKVGQKIITLSLQDRDEHILKEMKSYMNYEGNIIFIKRQQIQNKDQKRLSIRSDILCNDLINLGCVPRKSLILQFPAKEKIPKNLIRHFIRGLFDGDGSISFQLNKNQTKSFRFDISGTLSICNGVKDILINQLNFNDRKIIKRENLCVLAICGNNNIKKLYHYLYDDSTIFLIRKKERMSKVLE